MKIFNNLSLIVLFAIPAIASANKVEKFEVTPKSPDINTELQVKMFFAVPDDKVTCGITVDWGDGEKQKLRVGNGQQVLPPFSLAHTYSSAGSKNIAIKGESVFRGLSSVGPCDVNVSGAIVVQDPVVRAEAEKKAQLEKAEAERKVQLEAQRKEYLASPAGKKELETTKKNFAKLIDKPLAYSCADKSGEVLAISQKNNEITRLSRLSTDGPPKINQIIETVFVSQDTIALTNDSNVKTEYKFSDKSLQIYNSAFVVNGFYKSNNNPVPSMSICEKASAAGQIYYDEISGLAEKKRQVAIQKAQAQAEAEKAEEIRKEERRKASLEYTAFVKCVDQTASGLDESAIKEILRDFQIYPDPESYLAGHVRAFNGDCALINQKFDNRPLFESKAVFVTRTKKGIEIYRVRLSPTLTVGVMAR